MKKTNVMRILDKEKIAYNAGEYAYDENDLNGLHAARELGLDPAMVFKTLVAVGDKTGPVVFSLPVDRELDLKKAARAAGEKKVELIHVRDMLAVTGYIRGGCSPIGMKKHFPTYIEEMAQLYDTVMVSAGQRGVQVTLEPEVLRAYVEGTFVSLV